MHGVVEAASNASPGQVVDGKHAPTHSCSSSWSPQRISAGPSATLDDESYGTVIVSGKQTPPKHHLLDELGAGKANQGR